MNVYLVAVHTLVGPLPGVHTHVFVEAGRLGETLPTHRTLEEGTGREGLFQQAASKCTYLCFELVDFYGFNYFAAVAPRQWPRGGELSFQHRPSVKGRTLLRGGRAGPDLVGPVLLVDVEDVDPQAVPLLERSAAQVTGELPVALVHAAGVLQVFVPVVLVGEHLPAPVTFEALSGVWRRRKKELDDG